jgi:hypothetical protein
VLEFVAAEIDPIVEKHKDELVKPSSARVEV